MHEESLREPARLRWCVWEAKRNMEAQQDLQHMKERDGLHPKKKDKGRHYLSPASIV
jgi:hypothetical protein